MENYQYVISTGLIVPDTGTILTTVQGEYLTTFGADLILTPSTPQGILITSDTIARTETVNNNAAVANQINPNLAGGVYLDAIWALTGGQRQQGTPSVVQAVTLSGVSGTVISAGAQVQTQALDIFQSVSSVTIPPSGSITVDFQSVALGAIPCAAHALSAGSGGSILTPILGWETVDNATAAILGTAEQSDQSARAQRNNTLALQGVALPIAITSGLYATNGVKSLTFLENVAATTQVISGITMVAHSIYACVDGGTDTDVATTLLNKKSLGCAWNGSTSVNVTDPTSGQVYTVLFDRPTPVVVYVRATVHAQSSITDPTDAVINAILDYANGNLANQPGLIVGQSVSCFELAGAVTQENPTIYVQNMQTSTDGITFSNDQINIAVNQIASIIAANIDVVLV